MRFTTDEIDQQIRTKAFEHITNLPKQNGLLHYTQLNEGFSFSGERITLHNLQKGIHKPSQMKSLLSIETVYPKSLSQAKYRDQTDIYKKIYEGAKVLDYSFMGVDPSARENQHLLEVYEHKIPIIYFIGTGNGFYLPEFPIYVVGWDSQKLEAKITFNRVDSAQSLHLPIEDPMLTHIERRYTHSTVKARLHQSRFRMAVMQAYDFRCAISGFPEPRISQPQHKVPLIDVAHIVEDRNPEFGQPEVRNGLPLTKLHHAAYDANLIGIDAKYNLHVSKTLWDVKDGQTLELLKSIQGTKLKFPRSKKHYPDPERLKYKFQQFEEVAR